MPDQVFRLDPYGDRLADQYDQARELDHEHDLEHERQEQDMQARERWPRGAPGVEIGD